MATIANEAGAVPRRRKAGTLAREEARLAAVMLGPTFLIVAAVVLFPVLASFWISFKPVTLGDLRAPTPIANERVRGEAEAPGDQITIQYRLRNSSDKREITDIVLTDTLPTGLTLVEGDERCVIAGQSLTCQLGSWEPRHRERLNLVFEVDAAFLEAGVSPRDTKPEMAGNAINVLTSLEFNLDNFRKVFEQREFWTVLNVTIAYTIFGTLGSMILGLFAAQLLNASFKGRAFLRGLFLFPYVSPVIAVAFTWLFLLDPFSGTINALLIQFGAIESSINYLGVRSVEIEMFGLTMGFPLALAMVIAFEAWRYFPLAFLFILARMQSLPSDLYEAAQIDGATPFQIFRYITLPQLISILSVLFLLRFIWTFNKFDDIFLLTGGAAGTRTLTVDVYEQGFALANLGAGAAVSVVIFFLLAFFMFIYFRFGPEGEM